MRIGLAGAGRIGACHAVALKSQAWVVAEWGARGSVCVGSGDRLPRRSPEERVDFPSPMPYTQFMEQF
jgi:hypothetical protein